MCEQHFEVVQMTVCAKATKSLPHSEAIVKKKWEGIWARWEMATIIKR